MIMYAKAGRRLANAIMPRRSDGALLLELEELEAAIAMLGERQRRVLCRRYGLEGGPRMTLAEVGKEFGVTGERIRQIESRALRQLRFIKETNLAS